MPASTDFNILDEKPIRNNFPIVVLKPYESEVHSLMSKENMVIMSIKTRINTLIISAIITAVIVSGCWNPFSPEIDPKPPPIQYHNPVDSAYKVLENLQYAYISRDIGHYLACFRDDFEFHLLEIDWADYTGNGVIDEYWGLDLEEEFTTSMFNSTNVTTIDLTLSGSSQYPWTGDSTGQSLQLDRTFNLKVYTLDGGFIASGTALFICREDTSSGEWYIWQWWDLSDT